MRKRMPRFTRPPREARAQNLAAGYIPAISTLAGITVTPQTALNFTAVFCAINVLSRDLASLPIGVFQLMPGGTEKPRPDHRAHRLLRHRPNSEQNPHRYRLHGWGHTHGWGNSYSEIVRDRRGELESIWPLDPRTTEPARTTDKKLIYSSDSGRELFLPEDVIHIAGLGYDGIRGYCPVTLAEEAIGLGIGAQEFGSSFFGNGATESGVLEVPKRLTEVAQKNLRNSIEREHQGTRRAHRVMILEEGTKWVKNQVPPDAAQFLGTRAFQVIEIARMWNLPPHKLGDYSQSHLANIEESNLDYLQTTILGWVVAAEAEYNAKLFSEEEQLAGYCVKHDMTALMRGNMQARGEYYRNLRNLGVMNATQIATREGLNPIPKAEGGDKRIVQGQYVLLADVGKVAATTPGLPAPQPTVDPDAVAEPDTK